MLGLLFIYFIGKYFYELAGAHERSEWGFAILGVATYYIAAFSSAIVLGIISEVSETYFIDDMDEMVLSLIALPFGVGATVLLYFLLKNSWESEGKLNS